MQPTCYSSDDPHCHLLDLLRCVRVREVHLSCRLLGTGGRWNRKGGCARSLVSGIHNGRGRIRWKNTFSHNAGRGIYFVSQFESR